MSEKAEHTPLPCPFCGSAPVMERTGFSGRARYIYCITDNGCPRPKAIGETEEKAIENWNTRSVNSAPDLVKALEEMVETFKPFTMKPVGAPGSSAREDQEHQIAVHSRAHAALSMYRGEA